ncbi:MAG TPA: hypothetical protein VE503_12600 [Ornithinibacter sp.]|nr:hypothetical protein [Ornithinibacter sp.]
MMRVTGGRFSRGPLLGALALTTLLATACGGSVELPDVTPSRTLTVPTVSASIPEPSLSLPTRSPDPTETEEPTQTEEPTRTEEPTETEEPTQTEEPTEAEEPTPSVSPQPTPSPEPSPTGTSAAADAPEDEEDGISPWVWWLLLAVALAAVAVLVVRARRRRAWTEQLAAAESEVVWLGRDLLPSLRSSGSRERAAGAWAVSAERVTAAEDRLTALEATAGSDDLRGRATRLRDAVRAATADVTALVSGGPDDTFPSEVDAVIAALEAALRPETGAHAH